MAKQENKRAPKEAVSLSQFPSIMSLLLGNTSDLYGPHDEQVSPVKTPFNPNGVGTGNTQAFNPADLVEKNPVAQGVGKLAEAQALNEQGGARRDASGRITNFDPSPFGSPVKFQSAPERYADMTNHTGAYAPSDAVARLGTLAAMHDQGLATPMSPGRLVGGDAELPQMAAADKTRTEMMFAPRVADKAYSHGRPEPVRGIVKSGADMAQRGQVAANRGLSAEDEDFGNTNYIGLGEPSHGPVPMAPSSLASAPVVAQPPPSSAPAVAPTPMSPPTSNFNIHSGFTPEALAQFAKYLNFPNANKYRK